MNTPVLALNGPAELRTATISNGTSLSAAVDLGNNRLSRLVIPSAWTSANITFQTSYDGVTYNDLYDANGSEYTVTIGGASRAAIIPLADFIGIRYIKVRSGTTGSAVSQGGDRAIVLVLVP